MSDALFLVLALLQASAPPVKPSFKPSSLPTKATPSPGAKPGYSVNVSPPIIASAIPKTEADDLRRRVQILEKQNARLQNQLRRLQAQTDALIASYRTHTHQVNGKVGNGMATLEGKTVITGSYADFDLRNTGGPQPPFYPAPPATSLSKTAKPAVKPKPTKAAPAPKSKP